MIVVLTGAGGRLGRRALARLQAEGHAVRPLRLRADSDETELGSTLAGADAVLHLGGRASAGADPVACEEANVLPTRRLLSASTAAAVPRVLLASTGLLYGLEGTTPRREDEPTAPASAYAQSKLDAEEWVAAWAGPGLCGEALRFSNLYGPESGPDTVVGLALAQARSGGPIALRDPRPVRDFLWIEDAAEALLRLLAAPPGPGFHVVNVGSGRGVAVGELAAELAQVAGVAVAPPAEAPAGAPGSLVLDVARLRQRTGWAPATPLAEGLRRALAPAT
ncbi:MAG: NAD-dependent epimerase/dehydratase family protein [Vicinamibacteria bacterium]|nr:NAD-dependent epimerase/dehydratase family protein [Vicinamibacteria bacterium]